MWVKLDDQFVDHPKIFEAAKHLGKPAAAGRAVAVYVAALSYSNRHLTDGFIADAAIKTFTLDAEPARVARVLAARDVRLFERVRGGYRIHDYHDHNPTAAEMKAKKRKDRDRKRATAAAQAAGNGQRPARALLALAEDPPADIPNGFRADSDRIPRASRARDPIPIDQYVPIERSPRLRRGSPIHEPRVLRALVWAEVHAVFADPASTPDDLAVTSLTEHCKCIAAKAGLVYAIDDFHQALDIAIRRERATRETANLDRRRRA